MGVTTTIRGREDVRAAWDRSRSPSRDLTSAPPLVPVVLLFSMVLMRVPSLFGEQSPLAIYVLALAPLCAAILSLSLWRAKWRTSNWLLLALAYVALLIIAGFRGSYFGAITSSGAALEAVQFTLITMLGVFAFLREPRDHQRARYLRSLCWAPVVFLAISVVLHAIGFVVPGETVPRGQSATMLGLLGVSTGRVSFPMSGGLNGIGPTAVAALAVSITFVLRDQHRRLAIIGTLLSLYVILAIDSRGALMFVILAFAILAFVPRMRRRGLGWVPIALPILPVLLVMALTGLAETSVGENLNRRGGEGIATGTGRTVVWGQVTDVLLKPRIASIIGYGQSGQITSGASIGYAYLFGNAADPLSRSAHSLLLQTALDIGWLGALCLVALAAAVLSRLARRADDPVCAALRNAVLALILLGIVQSDPTPVHPDSFAFWLLAVIAAMRAFTPEPATSETPRRPTPAPGRPASAVSP